MVWYKNSVLAWALPSHFEPVCQSRSLGRRPVRPHSGCHLSRGSVESYTPNGHWIFLCTTDDCIVVAWMDRAWSLLQTRAHTDVQGCRMLLAACRGGSTVSEAGRANIPLEEGDSVSITLKQYQLSSLVLPAMRTYTHLLKMEVQTFHQNIIANHEKLFYNYASILQVSFSLNACLWCRWVGLWVGGSKQPLPLWFGLFEVKV